MAGPAYIERKISARPTTGITSFQHDPASPHTPTRPIPSTLSSPSVSYRSEEEPLVFELGARHFSAGFAGESHPRCTIGFGPEESRRVGDHRAWLPGHDDRPRKRRKIKRWSHDYELWRMDLRKVDLDLVGDKIERAVRDACGNNLLLDYKSSKKLTLVLSSLLPHPLLNKILSSLFHNAPSPSTITVLPSATLAAVAAGCRSGLVVDIGWAETIITAVYEYRELKQWRTTRAMRMVSLEMAKILDREIKASAGHTDTAKDSQKAISVDVDQAEEVMSRFGWCKNRHQDIKSDNEQDPSVSIPSPTSPRQSLHLPFSTFAMPIEKILFLDDSTRMLDDHEQSLPVLVYKSLLSLPPDVRALCMSRIIITGGGANVPGLKSRLLQELTTFVEHRQWDPVNGKIQEAQRRKTSNLVDESVTLTPEETSSKGAMVALEDGSSGIPPHARPHDIAPFERDWEREQKKNAKSTVSGVIRGVETLGAWAGASLVASLRVKGMVEIEKESFLQHGLAGARKDAADISVVPSRSFSTVPKAGERLSWTLGGWA